MLKSEFINTQIPYLSDINYVINGGYYNIEHFEIIRCEICLIKYDEDD
jgi:hypothetical protein